MRPRQSGGGTANDPVDFTLSDTEPVLSDAPVIILKDKAKPSQSSGSDIVELVNGKRVRTSKEVRDEGEASTSQLAPDIPAAKRSRQDSPATIVPVASTSVPPVKKKSTARKSTQHISSAHRLRWEATRATNAAAAAESNISHEEAMRQAAAERRRSQSARKPSQSPTKSNAEPGPGPSTAGQSTQGKAKHRALEDTNDAVEANEPARTSSPMMVHSESSPDPIPRPTAVQVQKAPGSDGQAPMSAPVASSGRVKPSHFQISDTPGSWGSALPMSVPPSSRPRSHTPKSIPVDIEIPEAGPSISQKAQPDSSMTAKPALPAVTDVPTQPAKPLRKGPTWKTAESPPPPPPQELSVDPLPSQPIDTDELDMEGSSLNTAGASLGDQSFPGPIMTSVTDHDTNMEVVTDETLVLDHTSPSPDLPSGQLDVEEPVSQGLEPTDVPSSNQAIQGTDEQILLEEETALGVVASNHGPAQLDDKALLSINAEIDLLLPSSITGDLPPLDAALLDLMPADKTSGLEIDDLTASLPEEMEQIDLTRSRESSSGGSFEEIPAEIARSQIVFSRPTLTQSSRRSGPSQPVAVQDTPDTPDAPEQRPLVSMPDNVATDDIAQLKAPHTERAKSSSSSSSGSPSKRLSTRLASRTLTPVYNFGNGREPIKWRQTVEPDGPIKWRQTVEMDGESDVEDLLRAPSRAESSGSSSMTIDGIERTLTATFDIPIVDSPPPPERRSRAIRTFDTQLIDEWNKLSPGLTHNPPLHRLIFESYIERCVDNEPEIKVYNSVDYESIPPNFEFQYSNEMLYNEDVPEPELGLGCDCEGGCSETSETCSCLKRQRLYNSDINDDFAYDKHGKLKQPVPIWECGPNCGCPPECMNRVVQRGRTDKALIDLFKTKKKGWGVRARNAIPKGTFLGIYSGEVIPEAESERRGAVYEKAGRTYLFDCDGYQIANPPQGLEEVDPRLAVLARDSARRAALAAADEELPGAYNAYSIDAFHYGNFTRFFNHCCNPNLQIVQAYVKDFHPERPLLVIFTLYDVDAGDELCISYKGLPDEEEIVPDKTKKSGKRRKIKKPKTTAAVHISKKKGDHKDRDACYCGADNCDGTMFNRAIV